MAIVKHIKSRNANYSAAINYLLFEHDEKTGKKIVDESGRSILRKEFYMDGLNCDPSTSSQTIHKDTRVGQLVITPVVIADFVLDLGNERGTGAFGSTGE